MIPFLTKSFRSKNHPPKVALQLGELLNAPDKQLEDLPEPQLVAASFSQNQQNLRNLSQFDFNLAASGYHQVRSSQKDSFTTDKLIKVK